MQMVSIPLYRINLAFMPIGWVDVQKWDGSGYRHVSRVRSRTEAETFIGMQRSGSEAVAVKHHGCYCVDDTTATHLMELEDERLSSGQVRVVMAPLDGHVDDTLDVLCEVNTHPEDPMAHEPCAHINQGDEHVLSIFTEGPNKMLLRLEPGYTLEVKDGGLFEITSREV